VGEEGTCNGLWQALPRFGTIIPPKVNQLFANYSLFQVRFESLNILVGSWLARYPRDRSVVVKIAIIRRRSVTATVRG